MWGHRLIRFVAPLAAITALALAPAAAAQSPTVTILPPPGGGPDGPTRDNTPTFVFEISPTQEWNVGCRVDDAAFGSCSASRSHATQPLADGPHTFQVRVESPADTYTYAERSFSVDTEVPEVTITATPPSPSSDPTPSWSFVSDEDVVFYCLVLGDSHYTPCGAGVSGDYTTHPLGDGDHTFLVTGFDSAGPAPFAGDQFTIDTMFPVTRISGARRTRDRTPTFRLSADPGSTFTCSVNGRAFRACGPEVTLGPLRRGIHSLQALATDPSGNEQGAPTYARLRIIPLPCRAYRSRARRINCRCNRRPTKAKRRSCRANARAAGSATAPRRDDDGPPRS